jgi:hypothetical protein
MSDNQNNVIPFRRRQSNVPAGDMSSSPDAAVKPAGSPIYLCWLEQIDEEGIVQKICWSIEPVSGRLWTVAKSVHMDRSDDETDYQTEFFGPFPLDEACLLLERNDAGKADEIREIVEGREIP